MVRAGACVLLAAALLCLPSRSGSARLRSRLPASRRPRWRPTAAGPLVLGGVVGGLVMGPGGVIAGVVVTLVVRRRRARRTSGVAGAVAAGQLADALRRITDELRTGGHPATALAACAADGPLAAALLAPAAAAARLGDDVPAALRRAGTARPEVAGDLDRVAATWSLAEHHGIPLADLLADAHDTIRWRLRFAAGVQAQLAGPRATATVLTTLPLVGIGLGQLMGADPIGTLRGGVIGQVLLVLGIGLMAVGNAWTERILTGAVPT